MTLLVIVAKVLVCVFTAAVAGLAIYAVMRFGDDEPDGRVTSWPKRADPKPEPFMRCPPHQYISAETLRRRRNS